MSPKLKITFVILIVFLLVITSFFSGVYLTNKEKTGQDDLDLSAFDEIIKDDDIVSVEAPNEAYLLSFILDMKALEPVILKDCVSIPLSHSASQVNGQVNILQKSLEFQCQKEDDKIKYACINEQKKLLGMVISLKDQVECRSFSSHIADGLKSLGKKDI